MKNSIIANAHPMNADLVLFFENFNEYGYDSTTYYTDKNDYIKQNDELNKFAHNRHLIADNEKLFMPSFDDVINDLLPENYTIDNVNVLSLDFSNVDVYIPEMKQYIDNATPDVFFDDLDDTALLIMNTDTNTINAVSNYDFCAMLELMRDDNLETMNADDAWLAVQNDTVELYVVDNEAALNIHALTDDDPQLI